MANNPEPRFDWYSYNINDDVVEVIVWLRYGEKEHYGGELSVDNLYDHFKYEKNKTKNKILLQDCIEHILWQNSLKDNVRFSYGEENEEWIKTKWTEMLDRGNNKTFIIKEAKKYNISL